MKKLSKESRAILRAIAVLDNIHYWKSEFVHEVCRELELVAFKRGLQKYFESDSNPNGRVRLDQNSNPVLK